MKKFKDFISESIVDKMTPKTDEEFSKAIYKIGYKEGDIKPMDFYMNSISENFLNGVRASIERDNLGKITEDPALINWGMKKTIELGNDIEILKFLNEELIKMKSNIYQDMIVNIIAFAVIGNRIDELNYLMNYVDYGKHLIQQLLGLDGVTEDMKVVLRKYRRLAKD